jgi:SAM-dependent methyltransferase
LSDTDNRELTPLYFRLLVFLIRPFPNFDLFWARSLRQKAVRLLQLKPGHRVLDVGCGPGGSFPYLLDAVGLSGTIVGVEISPEVATNARKRVEANRWSNVHVIVANAETAVLEGRFEALLMLGAPDAYASPRALNNLLPHLADGARVVAFGAKLSRGRMRKILSVLFRAVFSRLTFASTPALDYEPWARLAERVPGLQVEELFFGWLFFAWGSIRTSKSL